jgi:hypothetical protein
MESQTSTPEPAASENITDAQAQSEGQALQYESLFDEVVSEAELRGEEPDTPSETNEAEPSPPKDDQKPEEPKPEPEPEKPPKGYVPIQALHQERGQRQLLSQEIQQLKAELAAAKTGRGDDNGQEAQAPDDEFTVLSEQEFNELLEEDPVEAIKYDRKLRIWESKQAEKANAQRQEQDVIARSIGMMTSAVPGLYDQDSDVNQRLSDFAIEKGFADLDGLAIITDPRTRVVPARGGPPRLLGETAAHLVTMLNNVFQDIAKGPDVTKAKSEQVKAEVTKELLSKLKQQPAGHMSLGDVPGDAGDDSGIRPLTESDYAKMSDADRRRFLGG